MHASLFILDTVQVMVVPYIPLTHIKAVNFPREKKVTKSLISVSNGFFVKNYFFAVQILGSQHLEEAYCDPIYRKFICEFFYQNLHGVEGLTYLKAAEKEQVV